MLLLLRAALVCLLLTGGAFAGSEPAIMSRVKALYSRNNTFETAFTRTTWWEIREKEEVSSGRIILAPANKFRIEMGDAVWVCNGESVRQYSSKTGQVTIRNLSDLDISSHPSQLFSEYVDSRLYRQVDSTAGETVVESTDGTGAVGSVRMWIDRKTATIKRLTFPDTNGNRHTYRFTKTRFNPGLPENTFEFVAPKNAQILDLRD